MVGAADAAELELSRALKFVKGRPLERVVHS